MNKLYSDEGSLRCFYAYPKGLMGLGLGDTDKSVYLLLLDRARLSARSGAKWRDSQGRVFLFYPVLDLAADLGCCKAAVCNSLNALEEKDLIVRQRQGMGRPNRIYVKLPPEVVKAGARAGFFGVYVCESCGALQPCLNIVVELRLDGRIGNVEPTI